MVKLPVKNDLISRSALLEKAIEEKRFVFRVEDLLREEVIFQTVYKDLASFILSAPAVDAVEVVRCDNCTHQQKVWHDDKRMKEGGFFIYRCKLNEDPFVTHVVDGNPGEFCYAGERRIDSANYGK